MYCGWMHRQQQIGVWSVKVQPHRTIAAGLPQACVRAALIAGAPCHEVRWERRCSSGDLCTETDSANRVAVRHTLGLIT